MSGTVKMPHTTRTLCEVFRMADSLPVAVWLLSHRASVALANSNTDVQI